MQANIFKNINEMCEELNLANNASTKISGIGKVCMQAEVRGKQISVDMGDVLHVKDLRTNLLSVSKITDKGYTVKFSKCGATVTDSANNVVLEAERLGNLYYLKTPNNFVHLAKMKNNIDLWHYKMGHVNERDLKVMARDSSVYGLNLNLNEKLSDCEICASESKCSYFPKASIDSERST